MSDNKIPYRRICLKLTGEAFSDNEDCFSLNSLNWIFKQIKIILSLDITIAIVVGGGNILRGEVLSHRIASRSTRDCIGMLSTLMNGVLLRDFLQSQGLDVLLVNSFDIPGFAEKTDWKINKNHDVIIFSGGLGHPFFTTDTASVLKALEFGADIMIKATKVKGVYNKDPMIHKDAKMYCYCSFEQILKKKLKVMDLTAVTLACENGLSIGVIDFFDSTMLGSFLKGEEVGTLISVEGGKN